MTVAEEKTAHHVVWTLGRLEFNIDTILQAWSIMALVLLLAWLVTRNLRKQNISAGQFCFESIYDMWYEQIRLQIGEQGILRCLQFIASMFVFMLACYWIGILPWKAVSMLPFWLQVDGQPWLFHPPILDPHLPFGIAILSLLVYLGVGTARHGLKYWLAYFGIHVHHGKWQFTFPALIVAFIEWMDVATRPITLTLRIYVNVLVGEALTGAIISMAPWVLPTFMVFFEFGIGLLQSFVFSILILVYIGIAFKGHGEDEKQAELA